MLRPTTCPGFCEVPGLQGHPVRGEAGAVGRQAEADGGGCDRTASEWEWPPSASDCPDVMYFKKFDEAERIYRTGSLGSSRSTQPGTLHTGCKIRADILGCSAPPVFIAQKFILILLVGFFFFPPARAWRVPFSEQAWRQEIDRKDLAVELRVRLGDWFKVVQLVQVPRCLYTWIFGLRRWSRQRTRKNDYYLRLFRNCFQIVQVHFKIHHCNTFCSSHYLNQLHCFRE